jgi:hypothetical protein
MAIGLLLACFIPPAARGDDLPPDLKQAEWRVRDVAAGSKWMTAVEAIRVGLKLEFSEAQQPIWTSSCTVTDTTGKDRAVTLALCVPIAEGNWTWWDDPERHRPATGEQILSNVSDKAGGVNDEASTYPLCALSNENGSLCLAIPPDVPRLVRFVFDPKTRELRAEFDFGLSPVPERFKSSADATVVGFSTPQRWAFRQALDAYYHAFPDAFKRRVKHAGTWFPFNETAGIKDAADFGFAFHEISDSQVADPKAGKKLVDDDHRINCGAYVYVEPPTYWQQYTGKGKGTYAERLAQLEAEAKAGNKMAQGSLVSGIIRASGKRDLYTDEVAYTTQQPWGSNPNPAIPNDPKTNYPGKGQIELEKAEMVLGWRDRPDLGVDGVYVDSAEGWGEILNYNKDHWKVSQYPLTFDPTTKKIALLNFWGTVAWVKEMSDRLHAHNKLLMANDAFFRRWQLLFYIDIPGREYTWIEDGKFTPVPDERYLFFRAMSGKKPYVMLMNNRYDQGEHMEPYFQRSVFYAVFPSMYFGHTSASEVWYFANPDWYNRDRPLFKKYVPMIRKLDEAGWEAVPYATAEPSAIRVERYGQSGKGTLAFTVHNPTDAQQKVTLHLLRPELHLPSNVKAEEWISSRKITVETSTDEVLLHLDLSKGGYAAIAVR